MKTANSIKPIVGIGIATVLWGIMFSPWTSPYVNFWITMTISGMILTTYSLWADKTCLKGIKMNWVDILLGILMINSTLAVPGIFSGADTHPHLCRPRRFLLFAASSTGRAHNVTRDFGRLKMLSRILSCVDEQFCLKAKQIRFQTLSPPKQKAPIRVL